MNPIWIFAILIALVIFLPLLAFLIAKFGTYGFYKARNLAKRKEGAADSER